MLENDTGEPIGEAEVKVIIDGKMESPHFDAQSRKISLKLTDPLRPNYHVITFIARNLSGVIIRETCIFYIKE